MTDHTELIKELHEWERSAPADEFRFTLFFEPWVIKKENDYLVAFHGQPPNRRKLHLALVSQIGAGQRGDEVAGWVRRSGIMGLMSSGRQESFAKAIKYWWEHPLEYHEAKGDMTPPAEAAK